MVSGEGKTNTSMEQNKESRIDTSRNRLKKAIGFQQSHQGYSMVKAKCFQRIMLEQLDKCKGKKMNLYSYLTPHTKIWDGT